ncbi:hypothetical protein ON010_g15827 [Phytophthora cinnamomi]|nr:hypothetical protein ON010_g15827 [Phytophthora cinnamomi]
MLSLVKKSGDRRRPPYPRAVAPDEPRPGPSRGKPGGQGPPLPAGGLPHRAGYAGRLHDAHHAVQAEAVQEEGGGDRHPYVYRLSLVCCFFCRLIADYGVLNLLMRAAASSSSTSTSIPSLFDEEFDEWSKLPGNLDKWEKSLETIGN